MTRTWIEPAENDDIDCHLQQVGMGSLICRAARQTGDSTTNEVDPMICFNCEAGKIFRDIGCSSVMPKIRIHPASPVSMVRLDALFCLVRKRNTTLDYCQSCQLVTAETTRNLVLAGKGLFEAQGFYSAYQDLEKVREAIRDGVYDHAITRSIACLESVMRICHDRLGTPLPKQKQLSDLWKSTRALLALDDIDSTESTANVMNALSGVIMNLGGLRNALGDAHGRGTTPPVVSETIAELAVNTTMTLATTIIRRFTQLQEVENHDRV